MSLRSSAEAVFTLRRLSGLWKGAGVGDHVALQHPSTFTLGPLGYVIFVHGYNNSHEEARTSYARFRWWLEKLNARPRVLELHWPGDSPIVGLGWASYWRQTKVAAKCGRLLADWLEKAPEDTQFVLVGHSMGCRLILEALESLKVETRRRKIAGVCLMAAAVPIRMIEYYDLGPMIRDRAQWRILYSKGDLVLKGTFHVGQAGAFDSIFTRAVGFTGEPQSRWRAVGKCEEMHEYWNYRENYYGHGWYWPGGQKPGELSKDELTGVGKSEPLPPIKAPRQNDGGSAKALAELLGVPVERTFEERPVPMERSVTLDRELWSRPIGGT